MQLIFHPAARLELDVALQWSKTAFRDRTAARLRRRFDQAGQMLIREPALGASVSSQARRFPLRQFPYTLGYRVQSETITVIAVTHQSREPGYWHGR
jgi:toxin ParE1/3/4